MGVRNILILFFSTMAVSLVILIVLFNLVFKNVEMEFDTRIPESAPTLESLGEEEGPDGFRARNILNSSVQVPDGYNPPPASNRATTAEEAGEADTPRRDNDTDDEPQVVRQESEQSEPEAAPTPNPSRTASSTTGSEPHRPRLPSQANTIQPAPAAEPANSLYQVYIDGFASEDAARARVDALKAAGVESFVSTAGGRPVVKLGTFSSKDSADAVASQNGAKVRKVQ